MSMVGPWFNAVGESEEQVSSHIDDNLPTRAWSFNTI